jgi:hypothetical protein
MLYMAHQHYLLLQVSPECIGLGAFFTVSVLVLQLYLGVRCISHSTALPSHFARLLGSRHKIRCMLCAFDTDHLWRWFELVV